MKKMAEFYIKRAKLIGAMYCALPSLAWFIYSVVAIPFREVYALRMGLILTVGCTVAALIHNYGVKLWIIKHRSAQGPASVMDGFMIGMSTGLGINFLPPLASLISSNHIEDAKTMIIGFWFAAGILGALMGAVLAAIGRKQVDR